MKEQRKGSEIWILRDEDDRDVLIAVKKLSSRFLITMEGATRNGVKKRKTYQCPSQREIKEKYI